MAHDYGSFSYKTINKNIKKILDARSQLNNTVQVAMPFIKATTTIQHEYLGAGNIGFTLGLHGINEDVKYQDMYANENGIDPLIGYTYTEAGNTKRIYAVNPESQTNTSIGQIFDKQTSVVTYPNNSTFVRIPPPGITNVTIGRNKNGLLAMAQLQISIPSLIQLETLHRTFLVPGMGMILEWGQQFAPYDITNPKVERNRVMEEISPIIIGENGMQEELQTFAQLYDVSSKMFPWYNRTELKTILNKLARREFGLKDILEKYAYPSNGQYMWMFGRIANFEIKSNADGSFNATIKIVGPSEDAWAYSTKNTVVPGKDATAPYFCASDANSIYSYFADTIAGGLNLKTLLDKVNNAKNNSKDELSDWKDHVVLFSQGNQSAGEPAPNTQTPVTEQKSFADHQDAYFMTWRFFVNVVVNDTKYGIKAVFKRAGMDDRKLATIGLLLPYVDGEDRSNVNIGKLKTIDDPKEPFVGMNKYLRSVDPSTLIIVNEKAADLAASNPQYNIPVNQENLLQRNPETMQFTNATVAFEKSAEKYVKDTSNPDMGFLSSGVWINHKALVQSMLSADTFLRGVVNLLERMNNATMNYWQLTLDGIESDLQYPHPQSYSVIDANFRENSIRAVDGFLNNVHTFNKYIRSKPDGTLVGSDVLDCSIDLSLPKRLFSQIATMGLLSKKDIEKVSNVGGEPDSSVSMKVFDPNTAFAEMFGILSLSTTDKTGQGPDLTILPVDESEKIKSTCGKSNAQLVAATAGQGYQVTSPNPVETVPSQPKDIKQKFDEAAKLTSSSVCKKCERCITAEEQTTKTQPLSLASPFQINEQTAGAFLNLVFNKDTYGGVVSQQLLLDVNTALNNTGMKAVITSAWRSPNYKDQAANSRHIRGLAIDVGGIIENGQYYDAGTTLGNQKLTQLVNNLVQLDYAKTAGENPSIKKAILWQVPNHYNHIHISRLDDTNTVPPPTTVNPPTTTTKECTEEDFKIIGNGDAQAGRNAYIQCKNAKETVRQIKQTTQQSVDVAVRKFSGFQRAFRYVEIFPEMMVASITGTADGVFSNAFGASPGSLSIGGDIVLPGINGLRVGELFWIDRIPAFYKAFGAFQILSIEDTIDINGWKTKIHARFNYLGNRWKDVMYTKLGFNK